jgi:hypothetical protein
MVTINNGSAPCSGLIYTGLETAGQAGTITGFSSGLAGATCFDSSSFPSGSPIPYALCFAEGTLAPGATLNGSATVSGAGGNASVLAFTGIVDENNPDAEPAFVYAFSNAPVASCTPTPTAPPIAQSGVPYNVTWTTVTNPQTQFQIDESTASDFSANVVSQTIAGTSATFTHSVTANTTYYYRVRALSCGDNAYSATVSTVVQTTNTNVTSSRGADKVVPFGSSQPVTFTVPVKAPAGKTGALDTGFTATTDKPYLTVSPSSGTIPPGGTTVTVTANPGSLPPGANTGTVTVTSTSGAPITSVPLSVSLVTPVSPGGKTLPPSNALIIPVVTHVNGATSPFLSDVRLTNGAASSITYQLTFTPTRTNGVSAGKVTAITVDPAQTIALNDIVNDFFGYGATGSASDTGFGSLEIRPLNSSSLLTFASSRTYASTPGGTFGQFIAAIPFSKFIGPSVAPPLPGVPPSTSRLLSLQQIAQSAKFRTNLGLAEGSGQAASGMIKVYDDGGHLLATIPYSLQPGEHQQLNQFLAANGITLDDGRIEVTIDSATGAVAAYASVLDNITTDPLAVMPAQASQISATRYVIPGVADLNNGAANFHSDIRFYNGGTSPVTGTLTYYPQGNPAGAKTAAGQITIKPGEVKAFDNVLPALFGVTNSGGSVLFTTTAPSSVVATGRTYSIRAEDGGTFGQFIPGVTPADGIGIGDRPLEILQLEHSQNFRTNLGLAELTGNPVRVHVTLYIPDSKVSASTDVDLAANEFKQLNGVIGSMNPGNTYNARMTVEVVSGTGRVTAYGSVVDNATQDPTYVPAQ